MPEASTIEAGQRHYPRRLIREARRAAQRLELVLASQTLGAVTATAEWVRGDHTSLVLILGAAGAVSAVPITWTLRRRQIRRAQWLATTDRWWENLDDMPRMEPFPRAVDWVEARGDRLRQLLRRRPAPGVERLADSAQGSEH